jgi:aminopeptidase YwaD
MDAVQTNTMQHLRQLCAFGPRPVGSAENRAAGDYIRAQFERLGYTVKMQEYTCPYWEPVSALLELDGQRLDVEANPYSPDCDLTAETMRCGSLAELETAKLEGKILLVHGALAAQSIVASYFVYAQGPDPLCELIKSKNPAAVIAVESNPHNLFLFLEDWTFPIPSARVQAESGRALLRAAGHPVHLRLESRNITGTTANVVARRIVRGEQRLVVCAHFDTAFNTPGAFDNASGTAVLLALAERFSGKDLRLGLELVAFSGEDSGGTDFFPYAERCSDFENIHAAINVDGVGDWLGTHSLMAMGGEAGFEAMARQTAAQYPDLVFVDPWYESDHSSFFFRGVPVMAVSSKNFAPICHRPADTPDWIDPDKLERVVDLVEELILRLAQ